MRRVLFAQILLAGAAFAQAAAELPAFEVASVKAVPAGPSHLTAEHGVLTITCFRLRDLIHWSYDVPYFQLDAPDWTMEPRFDVMAKASGPVPTAQRRLMLRTLLEQRFKLACHRVSKPMEVTVMTIGKAASRLTRSDSDTPMISHNYNAEGKLVFEHTTMKELAGLLSGMGPSVLDQTGLEGSYDFVVNYSKFLDPADPGGRATFAAWREAVTGDLGFSIKPAKVTLEILVVDHVEKVPAEN